MVEPIQLYIHKSIVASWLYYIGTPSDRVIVTEECGKNTIPEIPGNSNANGRYQALFQSPA